MPMQQLGIGRQWPEAAIHYRLQPIRYGPRGLHQRFYGFVGVRCRLRGTIVGEVVERRGEFVGFSQQLLNEIRLFVEKLDE